MYEHLTNKLGDKLYILTVVSTNEIKPTTKVATWEECIDDFNSYTTEEDSERFLKQLIHKNIEEYSAEASMRCNRRGWGYDFFRYITIEPLYIKY